MKQPLHQAFYEYAYAKATELGISCSDVHIWTNYTITVTGEYKQAQIEQLIWTVNAYGRSLCFGMSGFDPEDFNNPTIIM